MDVLEIGMLLFYVEMFFFFPYNIQLVVIAIPDEKTFKSPKNYHLPLCIYLLIYCHLSLTLIMKHVSAIRKLYSAFCSLHPQNMVFGLE